MHRALSVHRKTGLGLDSGYLLQPLSALKTDLFQGLVGGCGNDLIDIVAEPHELPGLLVQIRSLTPCSATGVVQHDASVRQHVPFALNHTSPQ